MILATWIHQRIRTFLYLHCADLELARSFYTDVLGLSEIYFSAEERAVGYLVGELQIAISTHPSPIHVEGWTQQPGWEAGSSAAPSWGFECPPHDFGRAVEAARSAGVETRHTEPVWVRYWSFPVIDPMGNTVEISTADRDAWPPGRPD